MFDLRNSVRSIQLFITGLSLQTRFLLIFAVSSLLFALAAWFVFNNVAERMIERIGTRFAEKQALYDKTHTLHALAQKVALARQIADNAIIKQWATNEQNTQLYRQARGELEKYRQHFQGDSYFIALAQSGHLYFIDSSGQHQNKTQPLFTLNPLKPEDAWFYTTLKSDSGYNINLGSNPDLGVTETWINVLLRDGDKVLGVIGAGLDLRSFTHQMTSTPQSGITNLLINRNADIQIFRNIGSIDFPAIAMHPGQRHSTDQLLDNPEDRIWIRQAIGQFENAGSTAVKKSIYLKGQHYPANSPVATRFVKIKGKPFLASIVAFSEAGWYDITLLDLSALLPRQDFLEVALAIGGVSFGLIMVLLFSLRKLVLRPVANLTAASDRIRRGDYEGTLTENGDGEIGQLTAQFQAMRHAVHKTHNWMEEEIKKRTRELSDAKEMLEVSLQQERNSRENQANLLSLMAHEIRSPIAVISNTAQMLNALAQTEQPDWQPRFEKIMGAVQQLALLMNKLLDEDRINMLDNDLNLQMGDLNAFCREITDTLSANYSRFISYEPCSQDTMLQADWHLIGIAIGNLIDNAIKYSPPDSGIELRIVSSKENTLCVEVTDHGPGIAPEIQQRIFIEKFIRGEHENKIRGTGLGLYLINWIAISHGGYTEVSSTLGKGSTFRLCLPLRNNYSHISRRAR